MVLIVLTLAACYTPSNRDLTVLDREPKKPLIGRTPEPTASDAIIERARAFYLTGTEDAYYKNLDHTTTEFRNAVINDLIIVSDNNEKYWRLEIKEIINERQIALDIGALLFSTAGSVVPHASLAKIFSGTSTFVQGSNTAWDKRYIGEQTVDVIINAVIAERLKKKSEILESMKTDITEYRVSDGIRDAVAYDSLLTVQAGVSAIQQNTSKQLSDASIKVSDAHPKP